MSARQELAQRRWSEGMPGGARLAAELGVGHNTVDAALRLLEATGRARDLRASHAHRSRSALPARSRRDPNSRAAQARRRGDSGRASES